MEPLPAPRVGELPRSSEVSGASEEEAAVRAEIVAAQGGATVALVEGWVSEAERGALGAQDLSSALLAVATSGEDEGARMRQALPLLADRLIGRASDLEAPGVAEALWATAALREEAPVLHTLLPSLSERLVRTAADMSPMDAGAALCALAALRAEFASTSLLIGPMAALMVDRLLGAVPEFEPWLLANLLWSLALVPLDADHFTALLRAIVEQAVRRAPEIDPGATSVMLWAAATLQRRAAEEGTTAAYETTELLPTLLDRVVATADDMEPNALLTSVWALGALADGVPNAGEALKAVRLELACALDGGGMLEVSLALWGFVRLGLRDEELLDVAVSRALKLQKTTTMRVLATALPRTFWACAALDFQHALLLRTIADRFSATRSTMRYLLPEALHAIIWACPIMDTGLQFVDFREALEAKVLYWLRTRLNYVDIPKKTDELEKYFVMLDAVRDLGRWGPDARKVDRK